MEKDKEKAMYESPVTKETPVNLESGICAGSIKFPDSSGNKNASIEAHEENSGFDSGFGDSNTWGSVIQNQN